MESPLAAAPHLTTVARMPTATTAAPQATATARPPLRLTAFDAVLGAGLAALAAWWLVGAHAHPPWLAAAAVLAAALAPALARIDLAERRLPNALTVPIVGVGLVASALAALAGGWLGGALAVAVGAVLLLLAVVGGLGMGDVKLGFGLALAVGAVDPLAPVVALVAGILLGGAAGAATMLAGARTLAFGPWLLVGAAVAVALAGR